jgi:hypothetical protein
MFGASSQRSRRTAASVAPVDAFDLLKQISVDTQSDRCLGMSDPATNRQHIGATYD